MHPLRDLNPFDVLGPHEIISPNSLPVGVLAVGVLRPWSMHEKRHSAAEHFLLLFILLGDIKPQKHKAFVFGELLHLS